MNLDFALPNLIPTLPCDIDMRDLAGDKSLAWYADKCDFPKLSLNLGLPEIAFPPKC